MKELATILKLIDEHGFYLVMTLGAILAMKGGIIALWNQNKTKEKKIDDMLKKVEEKQTKLEECLQKHMENNHLQQVIKAATREPSGRGGQHPGE